MQSTSDTPSTSLSSGPIPHFKILYQNPELLVVHKPEHVAMDGQEHEFTVEKWIQTEGTFGRPKESLTTTAGVEHGQATEQHHQQQDPVKYSTLADTTIRTEQKQLEKFLAEPLPAGNQGNWNGGKSDVATKKSMRFVHQLDYGTSGILCLAFGKTMAATLSHCFQNRYAQKEYVAIVWGWVDTSRYKSSSSSSGECQEGETTGQDSHNQKSQLISVRVVKPEGGAETASGGGEQQKQLLIDAPVGYDPTDPAELRMGVVAPEAKPAKSGPEVAAVEKKKPSKCDGGGREATTLVAGIQHGYLSKRALCGRNPTSQEKHEEDDDDDEKVKCTMLTLRPQTGRRHQLRIHCAFALGHPIAGDRAYEDVVTGVTSRRTPRMMLHAQKLDLGRNVDICDDTYRERANERKKRRRVTLGFDAVPEKAEDSTVIRTENELLRYFEPIANGHQSGP